MEHGIKIAHNLETTPLLFKTNSAAGSGEIVVVNLYKAGGGWVGRVYFNFNTQPKYHIGGCSDSHTDFPSTLPSDVNKIWTITKLPGPKLTLQCNSVTVLDLTLSNSVCGDSGWSAYWSAHVEEITFTTGDTASDEYLATPPGN